MVVRSTHWYGSLLAGALLLGGCSGGGGSDDPEALATEEARVIAVAETSTDVGCAKGGLVDAGFRDAALATLAQLAVHAPGQPAHGAIRFHRTPGHIDPLGHAWHYVPVYHINLSMMEAVRVSPAMLPMAADWLRWQARQIRSTGTGRGVVFDHWVRVGDHRLAMCPPGGPAAQCPDVDSHDSSAASVLLMADAFVSAGGSAAVLREKGVRAALRASAGTVAAMTQSHGLSWAKPDYPVNYLMDAAEVAAGWRAWARVQRSAYGDAKAAQASLAAAQRTENAMRALLWHVPSQAWRYALEAGAPDFSHWYADTVAQAWPLLWGVAGPAPDDAGNAWRRAAAHWLGAQDWSQRNVDPAGFWWPAVAVAAHCGGDTPAARAWVARARQAWLVPDDAFAWPFHAGDLRWLFWMADPRPS